MRYLRQWYKWRAILWALVLYMSGYNLLTLGSYFLTGSIWLDIVIGWVYTLAVWFGFGSKLRDRFFAAGRQEVEGTIPLKAWKVAFITTLPPDLRTFIEAVHQRNPDVLDPRTAATINSTYHFTPLISPTLYVAEDVARCRFDTPGTIPHELENHACGFYAYLKRWHAYTRFTSPASVLLEVELYGDVIEGSRKILRGQYQRVLSVTFINLCERCRGPLPRVATGLMVNDHHTVMAVCGRHAPADPSQHLQPRDIAQDLRTDVWWRDTWIGAVSKIIRRP